MSEIDTPTSPVDPPAEQSAPWIMGDPKDREGDEAASNPLGLVAILGLFALLWFWAGPRYFLVVVGLVIMIFLHELGHYATARWTGMKVTQFFLFMGPRLWSFHRKGIEYGVRLLPLGAFVRIVGMHNLDPFDPADADKAYMNKSYPRRMLVITAGSIMHFIQAFILFVVITAGIGLHDPDKWSVGVISELETGETPAVVAGLQPGDDIVAIDGVDTTNWGDTVDYIQARPQQRVLLTIERGDETIQAYTELAEIERDGEMVGFLGVGPEYERTKESPMVGIESFGVTMWESLKAIPMFVHPDTLGELVSQMFSGSGEVDIESEEAERPVSVVGAVRIAGQPQFDITFPLTLLAIFNVFVGILNLMPLLPLDGGHAAIATYERLRSRNGQQYHVDVAKLLPITYAVVAFLGFIIISTVYLDIVRPIR